MFFLPLLRFMYACVGSRAASLSNPYCHVCVCVCVCMCVCLSTTLMLIISETKRFRGRVPVQQGAYRKVSTTRRCVMSSMTWRAYDVILVTSQYSMSSHSETRIRMINYPCEPSKHTPSRRNYCIKNHLIRYRSLGRSIWRNPALEWKLRSSSSMATSGSLKA